MTDLFTNIDTSASAYNEVPFLGNRGSKKNKKSIIFFVTGLVIFIILGGYLLTKEFKRLSLELKKKCDENLKLKNRVERDCKVLKNFEKQNSSLLAETIALNQVINEVTNETNNCQKIYK